VGVRVGVAYSCNKLTLRTRLRNINLKSEFSFFDSFPDIRVHMNDFLKLMGGLWALKWASQTVWGQSIGIDEKSTFQLKICILALKL